MVPAVHTTAGGTMTRHWSTFGCLAAAFRGGLIDAGRPLAAVVM
jgi:hypothetical protein